MRALAGIVAVLALHAGAAAQATGAVRGARVYTQKGPPIEDGIVLFEGGRITAVGKASEIRVPEGVQPLSAAVVVPGFIDARSTVGLTGILNQKQDQDQLETSAPIQPELRAVDAFRLDDALVDWVRGFGITTLHTGHAPGALVSGQTMIVKTASASASPVVMREGVAVVATLGPSAFASEKKSPGTRGKQAALLRAELVAAQEYRAKRSSGDPATVPGRNLRLEALVRVLDKEIPLIVTAHRSQDILTALRLAGEFGFTLWLDGAAEAYRHIEEIRAAGIPVLVHPPMARTTGELSNGTFRLAAILREAGIPFAFQSGFESYVPKTRVVTFEAAQAVAHGLSTEDALAALTINAARLLGIVDRVGSIEVGKDADLALFDGDPFEWTTHCLGAVVDGVSYPGEERPR